VKFLEQPVVCFDVNISFYRKKFFAIIHQTEKSSQTSFHRCFVLFIYFFEGFFRKAMATFITLEAEANLQHIRMVQRQGIEGQKFDSLYRS